MSRRGDDLDRLADLEEERRFLLRSLDDLDRERAAGDIDESDYEALRDGYTARAAAVIREIDAGREQAIPPRAPIRWRRVATITFALVAFGSLAGWFVARSSGQDVPTSNQAVGANDKVSQLLAQARQAPMLDALKLYGQVLKIDSGNVEALTYAGWYARLVAIQQPEGAGRTALLEAAAQKLAQAVAADPTYPDAQCFSAVLTFRDLGDARGAKQHLDVCLASNPPSMVAGMIGKLSSDIDAALAGGEPATTN